MEAKASKHASKCEHACARARVCVCEHVRVRAREFLAGVLMKRMQDLRDALARVRTLACDTG